MARVRSHTYGVFFLIILLLAMPWATMLPPVELEDHSKQDLTSIGATQTLMVSTAGGAASNLVVEVPYGEALTGLTLELEPAILSRSEGISWTGEQHFNHSDAIPDMVDYNSSGLGLMGVDVNWDLNNGGTVPTGWTRGSATFSLINTGACGLNGSSGASLSTRGASTYWDSPVVDLSGMSNGQTSYWVRQGYSGCGEEPDSNENFYAQYKTSSGSFSTLRTFSGSTNGYGASGQSYTSNLPSNAFHSNFQMRFYQNSGSGTCCDYWYFDDVSVTRPGGEGNWTSPSFGWTANASYTSLKGPHGIISIDADVPSGAVFKWSLIDATSGNPMPGFINQTNLIHDLGAIDWQRFPDLRLKLHMAGGSNGLPVLNAIHINGRLVESFHNDPADRGWTHSATYWNDGSVAGTGTLTGPVLELQRPLARMFTDMAINGAAQLEVSLDGGAWTSLAHVGVTQTSNAVHSVQFRVVGSGSWSISEFKVDLDTGGLPLEPAIDVGRDGVEEWELRNQGIGAWGWQDRLSNGALSHDMSWLIASSKQVNILLPNGGVGEFSASLTPLSGPADNVSWSLSVAGVQIAESDIGSIDSTTDISLNTSQLESMSENLSTVPTPFWSTRGIDFNQAILTIFCEGGDIRLHGIRIPYSPTAELMFSPMDEMVQAINDGIPDASVASGMHHVAIPLVLSSPGAMRATITNVQSTAGAKTDAMVVNNASHTVVASEDWIEVVASHLSDAGTPASVQLDLVGGRNQARVEWPLDGSATILSGSSDLIEWHPDNPFEYSINGSRVNSRFSFRLDAGWDDEDWFEIRCRLVLENGIRSVPAVKPFGAGQALGVENDIMIHSWQVFNDAGGLIPLAQSQIRAGYNISIEVQTAFDSLPLTYLPRSDVVNVSLLENSVKIATTSELSSGKAVFNVLVPLGTTDLEYRVEIEHLHGGGDVTTTQLNRSFISDSLAPYLVDCNIRHYDHLQHSSNQLLRFEIHDRPSLPSDMKLMLWKSWADDWDFDGWPSIEEYTQYDLNIPFDLSAQRGNYTFTFDDHPGGQGAIVAGYVVGTDPAGNPIVGGGGPQPDEHLFMYQLETDGSPVIVEGVGYKGGQKAWLHPGNTYTLEIPLQEPNGLSDIQQVVIELAGNAQVDTLPIIWTAENRQCISYSEHVVIEGCDVSTPEEVLTPFTEYLTLNVEFTPLWSMPNEGDLRREPSVEVVDRAGQSAFSVFPNMRWRWGTDLMIDSESVVLSVDSGETTDDGAWATPGAEISLTGVVVFANSGDVPEESFEVKISLAGLSHHTSFIDGSFYMQLYAPADTGNHPLTWALDYLPPQGRDVTDISSALFWIVVDGIGPEVTEVVAPRVGEQLPVNSLAEMTFDIRIKELEEIDPQSLYLNLKLVEGLEADGNVILMKQIELQLPEGVLSSQQIRAMAVVHFLSEVAEEEFLQPTSLHLWVTGNDVAGNQVLSSSTINSENVPYASWNIEQYKAIWSVSTDDIDLPEGAIEVEQVHSISITLRNVGLAGGTGEVWVTGHDLTGTSFDLFKQDVEVGAGGSELLTVDWKPNQIGLQWIEVRVDGEYLTSTDEVDVQPLREEGSFLGIEGVDDSVLIIFSVLVLALVGILFMFLKDSILRREGEWDGEELWEDESEYSDGESEYDASLIPQAPVQSGGMIAQPQHVDPYQMAAPAVQVQAQPMNPQSVQPVQATPPPQASNLTAAQAVHNPGVGPGWMQDDQGRWWKQNAEGYWYRLGEDGGWYPPEQNQYGWG